MSTNQNLILTNCVHVRNVICYVSFGNENADLWRRK